MKKRTLFLILCIALISLCTAAYASEHKIGDYTIYADEDDMKATITAWATTGSPTTLDVPSTLGGYTIVGIAKDVFRGSGLQSIYLPDNLTSVGTLWKDPDTVAYCSANGNTATLLSSFVSVAEPEYTLYVRNKKVTIKKYNGTASALTIPGTIDGVTVTTIGSQALEEHSLKSVIIPDSVTEIDYEAFQNCGNLAQVKLSGNLSIISMYAFYGCPNITSIVFPDTLSCIDHHAFWGTGLKEVHLPDNIGTLGGGQGKPFESTTKIWCHADGKTATNAGLFYSPTQPDYQISVSSGTIKIKKYFGNDENLVIPSVIDNVPVTKFDNRTFAENNSFKSAKIPNAILEIPGECFENCVNLAKITLSENLSTILYSAFYGCSKLTSVTIPETVTYIGDSAFANTGLKEVMLPDNISYLGGSKYRAFDSSTIVYCHANGKTAQNIRPICSLSAPDFLVSYASGNLTINKYRKNEANVEIPYSIDGVTVVTVGGSAFKGSVNLTTITIPVSIAEIKAYAFDQCVALKNVCYKGSEEAWKAITIDSTGNQYLLKANMYYNGETPEATNVYTVDVTNDGNGTASASPASGVTGTEVTLTSRPNEGYQFKEWQVITGGVTVKDNRFTIGTANVEIKAIFEKKAESVTVAGSCYELSSNKKSAVFTGPVNKKAKTLVIQDKVKIGKKTYKVTEIAAGACKGMTKLGTLTIGRYVKTIGKDAFYQCKKAKKIYILGTSLKKVAQNAFGGGNKKVTVFCPKKKIKVYMKLLKEAGISKKAIFKQLQ